MFVYERAGAICVTFKDNKPVENPEYTIVIDKDAGTLEINGSVIEAKAEDTTPEDEVPSGDTQEPVVDPEDEVVETTDEEDVTDEEA